MAISKMAAMSECFSLGSIIWCKTCYDQEIEGEVMAFDTNSKMLILKRTAASGQTNAHDVTFVNLQLVSELQVKKEVTAPQETPQSLNLIRLNTRVRNQLEEKRRVLQAMSANVSPEGQRLFIAISKQIQEVRWNASNIVVWDHVIITPPYTFDDIQGNVNSQEYGYIRKIVEKHMKDTALSAAGMNSTQVANNSPTQ